MFMCVYIYIIYTHTYIHMHTYILLSYKKNEILPISTTWMNLGSIMLNEVSQTENDNILYTELCYSLYMESKN